MWAAIPFFVSLVLLAGFIWFRFEEEKRGVRVFAKARDTADRAIAHAYEKAVMGDIPHHFRTTLLHFLHYISHAIVVFAVNILRMAERSLSRLSHRMRRNVPQANGKAPSEFLKTISEKKNGNGTTTEGQ